MAPQTELEICRDMSNQELIQTNWDHPLASLTPCWTALLERQTVQPESKDADKP